RKQEGYETCTGTLDSPMGATLDPQASGATGTLGNDDAEPTIVITGMPVVEGDSGPKNAVFNVSLSNPSSKVVSFTLTTADGTAVAGSDYVAKTETFTFNPGDETPKTFTVTVNGDLLDEESETFFVQSLMDPTNAKSGVPVTGIMTNDDARVRILGDVSIVEGNAGDLTLDFVVSLSTASDHGVTVNYTTENLTASSDAFDAPTIPLEFARGG